MTPQEKLKELEAARAERQRLRDAAEAAKLIEASIRNEERLLRLEEAVADAEKSHGALGKKVLVVHAAYPDGEIVASVILHAPSGVSWKRFKHAQRAEAKTQEKDVETDRIWRSCLVSPSEDDVNKLVDRFPALPDQMVTAVIELAGFRTDEVQKK